jgi:hypothetical protein
MHGVRKVKLETCDHDWEKASVSAIGPASEGLTIDVCEYCWKCESRRISVEHHCHWLRSLLSGAKRLTNWLRGKS